MGFLSSTEVIECSSSELVAEYIGQTGPRVRKKFDQALGKVGLWLTMLIHLTINAFAAGYKGFIH